MRTLIVSSSDIGDSSVGSKDDYGSCLAFESSVEERKAFHVEHVDLVDKEYSWNNLGFSLFSPLWYFFIDLLSNFMSDLACCSWEKCQKSLGSWIDHINFVKGDCVNDFLAFLYFTFWAIYKSSLRTHGIVVRCSSETSTCFWDFAWSLIDCDHIACNYFLFLNSFDHLLTQIVHGLHLSSFQGNLSGFCARSRGFLDLNLDYFSLNNFAFFLDIRH